KDGETVIDDLLLASKFAELENSRLELITQAYDELRKGNISKVKSSRYGNEHGDINEELQNILNNDSIARENKKFITDDEGSENEDGNLDSNTSTESDNEIQELVKREMKYRGQIDNNEKQTLLNTDDTCIDLSNEYLENFGLKIDDKSKCDELSDCEYEDDYDSRNTKFKNKDKNVNNLINSTCIPYIEIIDLPYKVDSELPCEFIGNIFSLVDNLLFDDEICERNTTNKKLDDNDVNDNKNSIIMVRGDPNSSMLDLGSVVCLEDKTIIGVVVDTFGPINSPFYVIRRQNYFIQDLNIGDKIFCDVKHSTFLGKAGEIQFSYLKNNIATNINGNNLSPVNEDLDDDTEEDKCETSEYFDSKGKSKFFRAGRFKEKYEEAGIQITDYNEIKKPINNNIPTCISSTSRNNIPRSKKLGSFNNTNSKQYGLNSKSISNYNRNTKYGCSNHKRSSDNRSIQYLGQHRRSNYRRNQTPNNNYSSHVDHYNKVNHNNLFVYHEAVNYPNNPSTIPNLNYPNLQNQQHMVMFGNQQPILGYQFLPQNQSIMGYQHFASPEQFSTNSNTTNQYQQVMQSFYIPIDRDTNNQVQIHSIQQFSQDNRNNNNDNNNYRNNINNNDSNINDNNINNNNIV
ncbi:hypothetical protein cand_021740, partial [Cryptosporidium andersoni]